MTDDLNLYPALLRINERPDVYSRYTASSLWNSPDISEMMLRFHLDGDVDLASRRTEFIRPELVTTSRAQPSASSAAELIRSKSMKTRRSRFTIGKIRAN